MSKRLPAKSKLPTMPVKSCQDQATSGNLEAGGKPPAPSVNELIKRIGGRPSVDNPIPIDDQADGLEFSQEASSVPASQNDDTTNQDNTSVEQTSTEQEIVSVETTNVQQNSFIGSYWPYLLIGGTLVGWVISQMLLKRDPSFKPTEPQQPDKLEGVETNILRGQFKKSERFVKSKDKSSGAKESQATKEDTTISKDEELGTTEVSSTKEKVTDSLATGATPTDDEFDLSDDDGSDSDVFGSEDAAEITHAVDTQKKSASSKRFKTEDDIDGFEITDDEIVSFDDEDSQLSLADSDTEFGFDLDDEESRGFLDSNKLAGEELASVPQDGAEGLADQKPNRIVKTPATGIAEASAAKGSFLSRVFGANTKQEEEESTGEAGLGNNDSLAGGFDDDAARRNAVADSALKNSITKPVLEEVIVDQPGGTSTDSDEDAGEFGFGLFEDENTESLEATEASNINNEPSIAEPVAAAAMAGGAGLAGITLTKVTSASESDAVGKTESEIQWKTKVSTLEGDNLKLSDKINTLLKLSDKVNTLEGDCLKLSDQVNSLEGENLKLNNQVVELTQQIAEATENATQADSLAQARDELTKTVESLKADKEALLSEKKQLAEEFKVTNHQHAVLEQEKADLLKQYEEAAAEKTAAEASASELASLQGEVETFEEQRSELESEIQSLKAKLLEAQPEPNSANADEEIEDLKERFKKRLTAERSKRKQAELLVSQAEDQRSKVAKLLQLTKAEMLALKTKYDNEDFDIGD